MHFLHVFSLPFYRNSHDLNQADLIQLKFFSFIDTDHALPIYSYIIHYLCEAARCVDLQSNGNVIPKMKTMTPPHSDSRK